jgi:raffinose/stachyose/melibiose transport system substrate-binding protein
VLAVQSAGRPGLSRRSFLLGAGALGAGCALAACAPAQGSSSAPTEITFYVSKPEVISYFDGVIEQFHRSQDRVRVIRDSTSNMSASFVRNQPPDLGCWNYNFSVAAFVKHGALSDLSDMAEAKSINPQLWPLLEQTANYPGRTSAIPYSMMAASVIYNKDIFAQHGLSVPATWTELVAVCKTLQDAGVTPFYNTIKDSWTVAQGLFDYSIGGMVDVPRFFSTLNDEGTSVGAGSAASFEKNLKAPMERMAELARFANKDAASRGYADGNLAFSQGKSAMYMQGPWALNEIAKTAPGMHLGTFPLPVTDNPADLKVRVNVDLALWIPEASKKKDAARQFLSFLMRPEINDKYNSDNNGFGVRKDAPPASNPALAGMQKYYDDAAFYLGASQLIPAAIPVANYAQSIALGAAPKAPLQTLDADWARLALRNV